MSFRGNRARFQAPAHPVSCGRRKQISEDFDHIPTVASYGAQTPWGWMGPAPIRSARQPRTALRRSVSGLSRCTVHGCGNPFTIATRQIPLLIVIRAHSEANLDRPPAGQAAICCNSPLELARKSAPGGFLPVTALSRKGRCARDDGVGQLQQLSVDTSVQIGGNDSWVAMWSFT